jgi:hypothetical protein
MLVPMKARILALIVTIFVAGTTGAVVLVAGAGSPGPVLTIEADDGGAADDPAPTAADGAFAHVKAFLATIPDPRNLFTAGPARPLPYASGISVRHFRRERPVAGVIEIARGNEAVGLFQACVEIIPIDANRFVLHRAWHEPEVVLICVDVARLRSLPDGGLVEQAEAVRGGGQFFVLDESCFTEVRIPRDLEQGRHDFEFPDDVRAIPEIVLLYPSLREESLNRTQVMRIEPALGRVTIVAPVGKAFLPFDEGRSAARLVRDPKTKRVVGDGVRVPTFVLSASLACVEKWLE